MDLVGLVALLVVLAASESLPLVLPSEEWFPGVPEHGQSVSVAVLTVVQVLLPVSSAWPPGQWKLARRTLCHQL